MSIENEEIRDISRSEDKIFNKDIEKLIAESEEMRLKRMRQHRMRSFTSINLSILLFLVGVIGFGWFFLIEAQLMPSVISILAPILPAILLNVWAARPLKIYIKEHKSIFMPKLANTLNGLKFHPSRGVNEKIIDKLAVMPSYDNYKAEDCFMGRYKGVKVIFSEARLYHKKAKGRKVFDGVFILLETPKEVIEGHTIITADMDMVKKYAGSRWSKMTKVNINVSNPEWDKFHIYSTAPQSAELMVGDRLLKELSEAADIFDDADLTAVLLGGKYMFIMIPYAKDMFEASDLFVPVTTKGQAMRCKKEIEQLLEIIDVFDLFKPVKSA